MTKQGKQIRQQVPTIYLLLPFLVITIGLIVVPVLALFLKSFSNNKVFALELLDPTLFRQTQWTIAHYVRIFNEPYYVSALFETFFIALAGVAFAALIGIPVAYVLSFGRKNRLVNIARMIITMPIFIPDIVICFSLLGFMGRQGIINWVLSFLGLHSSLVYNVPGVIIGTYYILVSPFILIVISSMERIDNKLLEASFTLGG